jgi:hypothetical protein
MLRAMADDDEELFPEVGIDHLRVQRVASTNPKTDAEIPQERNPADQFVKSEDVTLRRPPQAADFSGRCSGNEILPFHRR